MSFQWEPHTLRHWANASNSGCKIFAPADLLKAGTGGGGIVLASLDVEVMMEKAKSSWPVTEWAILCFLTNTPFVAVKKNWYILLVYEEGWSLIVSKTPQLHAAGRNDLCFARRTLDAGNSDLMKCKK